VPEGGPGTRLSNDADDHRSLSRAEWGLFAVCPLLTRARASPPLELLVHPDLDGVRLEKVVRRLALLLVGDVADDDRDHELALVGPISGYAASLKSPICASTVAPSPALFVKRQTSRLAWLA
jgi:hypothetical protein